MPESPQAQTQDAAKIMQAISTMLQNIGKSQDTSQPSMIPGQKPPLPGPNIRFDPSGAGGGLNVSPSRPPSQGFTPTGSQSIGSFENKRGAVNAGLVSLGNSLGAMFSNIEQKEQAKKSALAENYMLQINSLLASGDPQDKQKAMAILEDPKIRKILKTGLEYVPLEEDVPPEASGVHSAMNKIQSGKAPQIGGQQPQQKRPIIPQPNQQDQLRAALTNAMLQKIKQDPASAISMMGGSQLTAAEERASEFYQKGLGLSPAEIATLTAQEKLQGLKLAESATVAAIKGEIDMYKAGLGYSGKVDSAKLIANSRKYVADAFKEAAKEKKGSAITYAAGARIYEDYAKKYLDIIKGGKGPDGKPLSAEQIKQYQQKADAYQRQADQYLNQGQDDDLMKMFMKAIEEPDATTEPDNEPDNK